MRADEGMQQVVAKRMVLPGQRRYRTNAMAWVGLGVRRSKSISGQDVLHVIEKSDCGIMVSAKLLQASSILLRKSNCCIDTVYL